MRHVRTECHRADSTPTKVFSRVTRRTMCYNEDSMLCHFVFEKGATVPRHQHVAVQNGYVISGRVRFFTYDGDARHEFVASAGDGYLFESNQPHGGECLEKSELIECFTPVRPEYIDAEEDAQ